MNAIRRTRRAIRRMNRQLDRIERRWELSITPAHDPPKRQGSDEATAREAP